MTRQPQELRLSDDKNGYMSGSLLEVAAVTISSTLRVFIQAMVLLSEGQKRAIEDLERVVGPGRIPNIDDKSNFQHLRDCVKESL